MSRRAAIACLLVPALLVAAVGCGGRTAKKKPRPAGGGAAAETLPDIDPDTAITVDQGRLTVSSPRGWTRGPRSRDYLVRYTPTAQKTYPSITVTSADPPAGYGEVTAANHGEFVAAVAAGLAETFTVDGKSTLAKQPAAVTLGPHLGVAYAAPGQAKVGGLKEPIERSCLVLVVNGRLLTIEARAPKGKLDGTGRLAAKAVAAAVSGPRPATPEPQPPEPGSEPAAAADTAEPTAAAPSP